MKSDFIIIRNANAEISQVMLDESSLRSSPDYRDRWLIGVIDTLRAENKALAARVLELENRFGMHLSDNQPILYKSEEMP